MRVRWCLLRLACTAIALLLFLPAAAHAQSGIAGVVKDTSGALLPGVTVEASSPALIEKTRTVVTDESGLYKIVDLRPGTYAVIFKLEGFSSFTRDGIELPANFTATINAELKVGALEESVTVSGQSPVVDLQNAAQQQILPRAVIDAVPTGKSLWSIGSLVPGVVLSGQDVGGSRGMQQLTLTVHGSDSRDDSVQVDGMVLNSFEDGVQQYYNDMMFEEMNFQTSAISAETSGAGVRLNMIPKEGGNVFKGTLYFGLEPGGWVGDNSTPELVARGLVSPGSMKINRDLSVGIGGPVMKDKLWFFFSARRWGVDQYVNNSFYNLDPTHRTWRPDASRQVVDNNLIKSGVLRLTYRSGPHKYAAYLDRIVKFRGHECGSNVLEETCGIRNPRIYYTAEAKYTGTLTNKLLVEGGLAINNETYSTGDSQPSVQPGDIPRLEITGVPGGAPANGAWGAPTTRNFRWPNIMEVLSGSITYVTGSHAFKTGIQAGRGHEARYQTTGGGGTAYLVQRYRVGVPDSVTVYNTPVNDDNWAQYDLGIFAQDSWTMHHLTLSPGVRIELFNSYYPAQAAPAGRFIAARNFPAEAETEQPHWKDVAPRVGAVYDLLGDNTTAVKASWGRYVRTYHGAFSSSYNPMTLTSDTRTWTDLNKDDIAQGDLSCDINKSWNTPGCEIGPPTREIGSRTTQAPASGIKRPTNTELSVSVQRQIVPGMSAALGYTRRDYQRIIFTQNIAVQPLGAPIGTGYTTAQVPNPLDPTQTLTVYNLDPALLGATNLLDQNSPNNKRSFDAWDLSFQSRVLGGTVFGGASWGRQTLVTCDVTDPNAASATVNGLRFCDQSKYGMPFRGQYKLSGTYPLPYGVAVSGSFRSEPGGGGGANGADASQNNNYSISKAIFRTATGQTLTQTSVLVQLLQPGTVYLPAINTVDVRLSKKVQVRKVRVQAQFDIFNALNANPVTGYTQTFGASYQNVSNILSARIMQIGGTLTF
jgi:Carboxypeptidase regulatory-like domain